MRYFCASILASIATLASVAQADQVVQIPVDALLNARAVTTLTGGALVTWTVGVDGNGTADGYMTAAASKFHNDPPTLKTLPDDGVFAADARHPEVVLHFSNAAPATSQQTHYVRGAGTLMFAVQPATYSQLFLFVTSSEGTSTLKVTLTYSDMMSVLNITVPDYYTVIPANDPVIFNLASDLPKWTAQNAIAEMNHHNLTGLEIHPMTGKTLTGVQIDKTAPGYFVFWGATGIATGLVDDGGTDAMDATPVVDAAVDAGSDAVGNGGGGMGGGATTTGSGGVTRAGGSTGAGTGGAAVGAGGSVGGNGVAGQGGAQGKSSADSGCSCELGSVRSRQFGAWGIVFLFGAIARRVHRRR